MMNSNQIAEKLHKHGLRVTPQRIWVYDYLQKYKTHPDADEVYDWIIGHGQHITLSTVYNALQAFVRNGIAVEVTTDVDRVRYDANIELHGHFVCDQCRKLFDFNINKLETSGLTGFKTQQKDIYFSGVCNKCTN